MPALCDICHARPAVARATVMQDGERKTISICDYHFRQLMRHQSMLNPFDSLLGGGGSSSLFGGPTTNRRSPPRFRANRSTRPTRSASRRWSCCSARPRRRTSCAAAVSDSEHLLYALADTDVCAALLKELKLSPEDIKSYIDAHAHTGTADPDAPLDKLSISPRVKKAVQYAFQASRDLGHSYIGPEHLLIGSRVGAGQRRRHAAEEIRRDARGAAPEGREGGRQRRRGRPRRCADRHAEPRQVRPRPHRDRAPGQARPGPRPCAGNREHDRGACAPQEEQPGADRRAGRRQDGDRRRRAADRQRRRARGAARQAARRSQHQLDGGRREVSRRIRGAREAADRRSHGEAGRTDPVHRRAAHDRRCR